MGKQIKPSKATVLCNNFDAKYNALTNFIEKKDIRSSLFTIQEIKDYIKYLESSSEEVDGIRIYLGSYEDTNLSTVFLAPTLNGVDNIKLNALNLSSNGIPPNKKYGK